MIPERVVGARVDVGERVDVGDRPGVEGVVGPSVTRDDEAATTRMGGRRMRMRRARSSASVAVVWSVVCAIGARAAWGQMRPAPGDTYANSEYYIRDVGVEVSDLHGGKFCFAKEARHERPDIPEMFLRSKIPLEVRWTTTRPQELRHVTFGRHARAGRARLSVQFNSRARGRRTGPLSCLSELKLLVEISDD